MFMTKKQHKAIMASYEESLREEYGYRADLRTRLIEANARADALEAELAPLKATRAKQIANLAAANARRKAVAS